MAKAKKAKKPKVPKVYSLQELRIICLRRASSRWKYKYQCLTNAKVWVDEGHYLNGNVKQGMYYKCAHCKKLHKKVQVDHIVPISNIDGFTDWNAFVPNLLCELDNLQCLCKPCHKVKTAGETSIRAAKKKLKKKVDTKR